MLPNDTVYIKSADSNFTAKYRKALNLKIAAKTEKSGTYYTWGNSIFV